MPSTKPILDQGCCVTSITTTVALVYQAGFIPPPRIQCGRCRKLWQRVIDPETNIPGWEEII